MRNWIECGGPNYIGVMRRRTKLVAVLVVFGVLSIAHSAQAVTVGEHCTRIGSKATTVISGKRVKLVCKNTTLKKTRKKKWVRVTLTTSTTSTTSTTVPVQDFVDTIESVESANSSRHRMTFSDGVVREYKLVLPVNYDPRFAYPLAIGLHGVGGTTSSIQTVMSLENGLIPAIVVYPQGVSFGIGTSASWNAGTCCEPATTIETNDVKFVSRLIGNIENQFKVDKSRVWAIGFSNGGMMAYRLGCEISDQITGVGVGAGSLTVDDCTPTKKFSAIHIHGDFDEDVPLNGGGPYNTQSATYSIETVASAVGCTKDVTNMSANSQSWQCPDSMEMKLRIDTNQDHHWNSNWTDIMLHFLQSHPRN